MYKRKIFIVLSALFLLSPVSAKADSDFRIWFETGLKYRIDKKFRFDATLYTRLDDDASRLENAGPEFMLTYRALKFLRLGGGYRFMIEPTTRGGISYTDLWHRFYADVKLDHTVKPVNFAYRLRCQEEFAWIEPVRGFTVHNTVRNLAGLEFRAGKGFFPFISGEVWLRLGDDDGVLHKWRATGGLDYEYRSHEFSIFYRAQGRLDDPDAPLDNILGLNYFYNFGSGSSKEDRERTPDALDASL